MFETGDIVGCYAPTVGYKKYHLCISQAEDGVAGWFLFINSENNYDSDFVLKNDDIDCIPKNDTGLSVISCSFVVRLNLNQLKLYEAEKLGSLARKHIGPLIEFISNSKALPRAEKNACVDKLTQKL